jgi:hypothetical protein
MQGIESGTLIAGLAILILATLTAVLLLRRSRSSPSAEPHSVLPACDDASPQPPQSTSNTEPAAALGAPASATTIEPLEIQVATAIQPDCDGETVLDHSEHDLPKVLAALGSTEKHRIIYRFLPHMRGILFDEDVIDGHFTDAVQRAGKKGWGADELAAAAVAGNWRRREARQPGHDED